MYDLGGGTFDISILEVAADTVEVRSTNGDTHLGGDDFDQKVIHWMPDEFKSKKVLTSPRIRLALQRIKGVGREGKIELSTAQDTEINQPFINERCLGSETLGHEIDAREA